MVHLYTSEEWQSLSEDAHLICFNEPREAALDRVDYALLAVEKGTPLAYMTCYEHDATTVYLQYGGKFPHDQGTIASFKGYTEMLKTLAGMGYDRALTYVENTNTPMLRIASKAGWLITGVRVFKDQVLVEHTLEFRNEESK